MLRNIPNCISPDLMHALMSMGHGDEIVLADADYPGATFSQRLLRADGMPLTTLLEAILPFFPLDPFTEKPIACMDYRTWSQKEPASYAKFRQIIKKHEQKFTDFDYVERFEFYSRTKKSFAVVMTAEADGNLILKKGVIML